MIYLHLLVDYKPNSFPPLLLYVCGVYSTYCMFVVCHSVHASVPVGVVNVLFDSLIHSVMPLSLFSCLQSSVGSTLLFRLKVRSSARQTNS